MLADQLSEWAAYPTRSGHQRLWATIRLSFLHALWCVHTDADAGRRHSFAVVELTVQALRAQAAAHFNMAALPGSMLDALPSSLLTAELKVSDLTDFRSVWCNTPAICTVSLEADGSPRLHLHLSLLHPVAAPVPPVASSEPSRHPSHPPPSQPRESPAGSSGPEGAGAGGAPAHPSTAGAGTSAAATAATGFLGSLAVLWGIDPSAL
jgi:hypothetical protein